jgi:outer membrane protein W
MRNQKVTLLTLAAVLVAATGAQAQAYRQPGRGHWGETQAVRFQLGVFDLRGDSDYWNDKRIDFTGSASDFEDINGGIGYVRFLGPRLGVTANANFYSGNNSAHYIAFVDPFGGEIQHDTTLDLANFNLGLLFHILRRDATVVPYVGAGVGIYTWQLTESGDFIDFTQGNQIFSDTFKDDGATFGHYFQAGLEVPIATNWSLFFDTRWERAKDTLSGDFQGLGELDLSGKSYSLGGSFSF